jgi:hypothetical protein
VGVLTLILGRKLWMLWEDIGLGRPPKGKQRYFTDDELRRIIEASSGQYRVLFSLLAGTGVRIGDAADEQTTRRPATPLDRTQQSQDRRPRPITLIVP